MVVQAAKALAAAENEEGADTAKIAAAMVVHADAALEAADYDSLYSNQYTRKCAAERYMRRAKAAVEVAEAAKALAAAVTEEEVADAKRYQRTAAAWVVAADEAEEEAAAHLRSAMMQQRIY